MPLRFKLQLVAELPQCAVLVTMRGDATRPPQGVVCVLLGTELLVRAREKITIGITRLRDSHGRQAVQCRSAAHACRDHSPERSCR
jgi:hypothetical protein